MQLFLRYIYIYLIYIIYIYIIFVIYIIYIILYIYVCVYIYVYTYILFISTIKLESKRLKNPLKMFYSNIRYNFNGIYTLQYIYI